MRTSRNLRSVAILAAVTAAALVFAASAGAKVYFMDIRDDQISVGNSTGQITDSNFIPTGRTIGPCCTHNVYPFGLATDGPHMFWSNTDEDQGTDSSIGIATLDDTGEPIQDSIDQTFTMVPGELGGIAASIQPDGTTFVYYLNGPANDNPNMRIGRLQVDADGALVPGSQDDDFITGVTSGLHVAANEVTTDDGHFTDIYWSNQGTDSIGHARVDSSGALVGTPDPLAVPPNVNLADPNDEPDVWGPGGVAARDGYLYWADREWRYPGGAQRGDGHNIGRVALDDDGLPSGPVDNKWVTGNGLIGDSPYSGTQTANGISTDGGYLYFANFAIYFSDLVDDIGRAPIGDNPNGPGFQFSFFRTPGLVTSIAAMRDATVIPSCPTSKEQIVHCTFTVKDPVATGAHAPIGHLHLSSRTAGGVWEPGAECLLSVVGPDTSTCSVDYDRAGTNGELITAAYAGDTLHSASSGSGNLLPVPVDPPDDGDPTLPGPGDNLPPSGNQNPGTNPGGGGTGSKSKKCKKKKGKKKKKCKKGKKKK